MISEDVLKREKKEGKAGNKTSVNEKEKKRNKKSFCGFLFPVCSLPAPSSETQGQIVGTRESLNGRKNVARRKVKNGDLYFSSFHIYFSARLDFPSPPLSAPGSPRRSPHCMEIKLGFFNFSSPIMPKKVRCTINICLVNYFNSRVTARFI